MITAFDTGWAYLVVLNERVRLPERVSYTGIFFSSSVLAQIGLINVKTNCCTSSKGKQKDVRVVRLHVLISQYLCYQ